MKTIPTKRRKHSNHRRKIKALMQLKIWPSRITSMVQRLRSNKLQLSPNKTFTKCSWRVKPCALLTKRQLVRCQLRIRLKLTSLQVTLVDMMGRSNSSKRMTSSTMEQQLMDSSKLLTTNNSSMATTSSSNMTNNSSSNMTNNGSRKTTAITMRMATLTTSTRIIRPSIIPWKIASSSSSSSSTTTHNNNSTTIIDEEVKYVRIKLLFYSLT